MKERLSRCLFGCLLCVIAFTILLTINQVIYLAKVQFVCTEKIERGEDLNLYETLSAYQTHTALWMIGGFFYPNTAYLCFCKQFHITYHCWPSEIKDNAQTIAAKKELDRLYKVDSKHDHEIRLVWKDYKDDTSLLLNGSYMGKTIFETKSLSGIKGNEMWAYEYKIDSDYKPGIIKVGPITLSETVFDYLENKHIIGNDTYYRMVGPYSYVDE